MLGELAHFSLLGPSGPKEKVTLNRTGVGYVVNIQSYPELTKTFPLIEAGETSAWTYFRDIHNASYKDWGSTEIVYREALVGQDFHKAVVKKLKRKERKPRRKRRSTGKKKQVKARKRKTLESVGLGVPLPPMPKGLIVKKKKGPVGTSLMRI
jgi:hypothetical protein